MRGQEMKEIFKKVDFNCLEKPFLNDIDNKYFISNLGQVKKDNKIISLTNKNNKRLIFRINYNNKRYEIGVASLIAIYFIDKNFNSYTIKFKDKNCINCKLENITLVYKHMYRTKSDYLLDLFNEFIHTDKHKRIIYSLLSRKLIVFKPYFNYEDLYQEFILYLYEHLNLFSKKKHENMIKFSFSIFRTWYSKYIISKIRKEKFDYDYLEKYQESNSTYNMLYQVY